MRQSGNDDQVVVNLQMTRKQAREWAEASLKFLKIPREVTDEEVDTLAGAINEACVYMLQDLGEDVGNILNGVD